MKGTRGNALLDAHKVVNGERQDQYGEPEDSFACIADLWNAYLADHLQANLNAHNVAMMMALLKVARIKTGAGSADCYVDLCGYAALAADMWERDK